VTTRPVRRLGLILAGLAGGVLTVIVAMLFVGLDRSGLVGGSGAFRLDSIPQGWRMMMSLKGAITLAVLVPVALIAIVGELGRIRLALYYMAGGALAVAYVPALVRAASTGTLALPQTEVAQVALLAGAAGGYVYWAIAGRNA
jgi:hypothetical protein